MTRRAHGVLVCVTGGDSTQIGRVAEGTRMLARLDRISDRWAYTIIAVFFVVSVAAALATPLEMKLGAWVQLVIWHGMLKWAVISLIFVMGAASLAFLVTKRRELYDWAHALQLVLLPMWCLAVFIGAAAAKFVWGSWNLAERRMTMSVIYIIVAAIALVIGLALDKPALNSVLIIATSLSMAALLVWIALGPAEADVHPSSAVMSSDNAVFKIAAAAMLLASIVWVAAAAVPVHRWLKKHAEAEQTAAETVAAEA
jgi:hypothetical protein